LNRAEFHISFEFLGFFKLRSLSTIIVLVAVVLFKIARIKRERREDDDMMRCDKREER
jgi:hypothetical protein